MDGLLAIYDALLSIEVPAERARGVVTAMERDMETRLATKADLAVLRQDLLSELQLLRRDMDAQANRITIRLAAFVGACQGLVIAALKLT